MGKRLIIVAVALGFLALAIPAFAAVQNVKVSGDLTAMAVTRQNFQLDGGVGESQAAFLSIARLRADFDLTDKVAATIRLINERTWGQESDANTPAGRNNSDIDLDLAYVNLKEFLYSPLTLTIGRQELRFGNALIIGDWDTNGTADADSALNNPSVQLGFGDLSARKAFDAIRFTLDYNPLTIDGIYSKIDENSSINESDSVDLYGVNANYVVNNDLTTEAYYFNRVRQGQSLAGNAMPVGDNDIAHTLGARGVYTGIKNMTLGLEYAFQFGDRIVTAGGGANVGTYPDDLSAGRIDRQVLDRKAWALQATGSYVWADNKYKPSVSGSFTHLSGAKDGPSDNYTGWDPMFEDQGGGTIFNKILGYSNADFYQVGASAKPWEDVTLALDYYHIRLVKNYTNMWTRLSPARNLSGVAGGPRYFMTEEKEIGNEWDVNLTYDYTEDVQFGLSAGVFIPGKAFDKKNNAIANQLIGKMKVTF